MKTRKEIMALQQSDWQVGCLTKPDEDEDEKNIKVPIPFIVNDPIFITKTGQPVTVGGEEENAILYAKNETGQQVFKFGLNYLNKSGWGIFKPRKRELRATPRLFIRRPPPEMVRTDGTLNRHKFKKDLKETATDFLAEGREMVEMMNL